MIGTKKLQQGFTLLETLVSSAIFAVIMIVVGSVFVASLSLQARALNIQQVVENSQYVLELMTKEIRVSKVELPSPPSVCPPSKTISYKPTSRLTMTNQDGDVVTYALSGTKLTRSVNGVTRVVNSNTVEFLNFGFCVTGVEEGDYQQPRVTIVFKVKSVKMKESAAIKSQITISPRILSN